MNPLKRIILAWLNPQASARIERLEEQGRVLLRRNAYLTRSNAAYAGLGNRLSDGIASAPKGGYRLDDAIRDGIYRESDFK